jgi:hypothetical protein
MKPAGTRDYNANGYVDQGDLDLVLLGWGSELADAAGAGWYNDLPSGPIDQEELDKVLLNWGGGIAANVASSETRPARLQAVDCGLRDGSNY